MGPVSTWLSKRLPYVHDIRFPVDDQDLANPIESIIGCSSPSSRLFDEPKQKNRSKSEMGYGTRESTPQSCGYAGRYKGRLGNRQRRAAERFRSVIPRPGELFMNYRLLELGLGAGLGNTILSSNPKGGNYQAPRRYLTAAVILCDSFCLAIHSRLVRLRIHFHPKDQLRPIRG